MAKVTPVLWKHKKNRDGHHPIYLRVADADRTLYRSLGVFVRESLWNERAERVRKGHPNSDAINALIAKKLAEAEAEELRLRLADEPVTAEAIRDALVERKARRLPDFFAYAASVADEHEQRGGVDTARRYRSIPNKFEEFTGRPLPLDRITLPLLRGFETHLIKKGNKINTRATAFRAIKAILRRAIKDGLMERGDDPFYHFKIKQEKTEKAKLTWGEVNALEGLELETGSVLWHVRNFFMLAFYCAGVRFGDMAKLRWRHVVPAREVVEGAAVAYRRLDYRMSKTGKGKSLPLLPQAEAILAHYEPDDPDPDAWVLPLLDGYDTSTPEKMRRAIASQNTLTNGHLKELAVLAGIKTNVTTHIARHSWTEKARTGGLDLYSISKALGHSNLTTTETYLKSFDAEALDEHMRRLFEDEQ